MEGAELVTDDPETAPVTIPTVRSHFTDFAQCGVGTCRCVNPHLLLPTLGTLRWLPISSHFLTMCRLPSCELIFMEVAMEVAQSCAEGFTAATLAVKPIPCVRHGTAGPLLGAGGQRGAGAAGGHRQQELRAAAAAQRARSHHVLLQVTCSRLRRIGYDVDSRFICEPRPSNAAGLAGCHGDASYTSTRAGPLPEA